MSIRKLRLFCVIAAISCTAALAQTTTATRTTSYTFPLVGLASSESAEVNLINLAANPTSGLASSCTGTVTFTNASSGTTVGGAKTFTLGANQVASISPTLSNSVITVSGRVLLRAVVQTNIVNNVPCSLASTLTTFDTATGVTHVLLVGSSPAVFQPVTLIPGH